MGPCLCFSLQPTLFSCSSLTVLLPLQPLCFSPSRTSLFPLQSSCLLLSFSFWSVPSPSTPDVWLTFKFQLFTEAFPIHPA